ncbi:MAG: secretin and TonB N-terminal domain-containing protein [Deltaproteobacteria bacterium]|nr:secretin and TonB N-terminal domain-containing protein [Deltaproteobacteria bacterium]
MPRYTRLLLSLLSALIFAGCSAQMVRTADEMAARGEWDEAVLTYRDVYQKDPGNLGYRMKYTRAKSEAAQIHFARGEEALAKGEHESAMLEFQAALLLDSSLEKAKSSMRKAKKEMDSLYYYGKGMDALKNGDEKDAKSAFKKAVSLNRENQAAAIEIDRLKKQQKVVMDGYELDIRSQSPITLEFKDAGIKKVFEVISKLSGINFIFDSDVKDDRTTVFLKNATFQQALDLVLMTSRLSRKVVSENTIIIYPATPQKSAQYEETMIRVFYLANTDAKKAVNLLRTMLRARDIIVHEELNAIVLRARPDAIELAQKILDATDLADAEVMLEVNIMEINRNKASNLGIDLSPDTITAAVPTTNGTITLGNLRKLASGDLLIGLPTAILNIKKEDLDANILANPRIRVRNNGKAKIHVGERVPIITTTVNQGVSTENVQYQDVGLKLSVEPTVRQDEDIDLKLGLEVSSLGTKTTTSSGSVVYQIGTRNTETVLRLHDGETQVFGGLINDEERKTVARIPLLGEVPVIGKLFARSDNSDVKTEILLSITPRVIRKLEVPDDAAAGFLSGRDENPSARPLLEGFAPDEQAGLPLKTPPPAMEAPQPMPAPPMQTQPEPYPAQPFIQQPPEPPMH